jgi:RNA polymerase sigma-70 factor (ECF subfamily)
MTLLKNRKKLSLDYTGTDELVNTLESGSSERYHDEDFALLFRSIRKLKEIDKGIILLYLEEKSYAEIAEIMGLSTNTVGVRITRIKSKLKEMMDGKIN